jgi:hypothetical protein
VAQYTEGHDPHRKNQQGRGQSQDQKKENQSNNRLLNDVGNSENTLEQGSGWIKDINKNLPKWLAAFFAPILSSLFGTISNSKADAAENTQTPSPQQTAQKPKTQNSQQPQDDCNANSNQGDKPKNWSLDLPCFVMKNGHAQSNGYCRERTNVTEQGNSVSGQIPLTVNGARMQWSLSGSLSGMVASPTGNECAITFENISRVTNGNKLVAINGTAKTCGVSGSFHMRNLNPDDDRSKQQCPSPKPQPQQTPQPSSAPVVTQATINGSKTATFVASNEKGTSTAITFTYKDANGDAASWTAHMVKGTINPPNGGGTISAPMNLCSCDTSSGRRCTTGAEGDLNVVVTDTTGLSSSPVSVHVICRVN